MPNSYNGWPVLTSDSPLLTTIEPVPGRKFRVRAGGVAVVLAEVIRRFHAEVEPIDQGILDDWSHNYRLVREGSSWSNHASGTAVDLNATRHPFRTSAAANFTPAQINAARRIVADMAPVVRWIEGSDPMHWEINYQARGGTPEAVDALAARLTAAPAPAEPLAAKPRGLKVDGDYGPATVRALQQWVGARPDGIDGPATMRALQSKLGVRVDGKLGPVTIKALQRKVGARADGVWGPGTTRALQNFLNGLSSAPV